MKTMMATCMIFKLLFWSFLITVFMTNLNYGQSHLVTDTFSRQKETVLLKEILKLVKNQAKKMQTLERELTSINDQLSKCLSISRAFPSGRHDEEQQDTTPSLISRENSTTLETNPTIQLTSASDIPVVETEGETATRQDSLSAADTAISAGISISRSFSSGRNDKEQQGTTTSLVSREQSTILETNSTIQLTSASDIPVVEREGETATRQDSFSTRDTATSAGTCGGTFYGQLFGYITSPNYPSYYPRNANCEWNIIFPNGYGVKLRVMNFSTENGYDYVEILDPIRGTQIGRYSGTIPAGTLFYSSAESIVIKFSSDYSVQKQGFYLQFEPSTRPKIRKSTTTTDTITETMEPITIAETTTEPTSSNVQFSTSIGKSTTTTDTITETMEPITIAETTFEPTSSNVQFSTSIGTCGGTFYGQLSGYITSPNYPSYYPRNANCEWNIILPNGYGVKLLVIYFSTENVYDYVEILDPIRRTQIGRYSGIVAAGTLLYSSAESIVIKFSSDSTVQKRGFYLQFEPSTRPKILKSTTTTDTITETMEPINSRNNN